MAAYRQSSGARKSPRLQIAASFFVALALEFAPWGQWLFEHKPVFPALALVYWSIYHPRAVGYAAAVMVGLATDLAAQTPMGFNALAYCVMLFAARQLRGRFALLGTMGQAAHVLFILATSQFVLYLLGVFDAGLPELAWRRFAPSMSGAALWVMLPLLLNSLKNARK